LLERWGQENRKKTGGKGLERSTNVQQSSSLGQPILDGKWGLKKRDWKKTGLHRGTGKTNKKKDFGGKRGGKRMGEEQKEKNQSRTKEGIKRQVTRLVQQKFRAKNKEGKETTLLTRGSDRRSSEGVRTGGFEEQGSSEGERKEKVGRVPEN